MRVLCCVVRIVQAELDLRPRGNCNQILKKMVEDATGLDLRQRVSQVMSTVECMLTSCRWSETVASWCGEEERVTNRSQQQHSS